MKLWAWLRSWFYCPLDWMELHGPENCWTCFYRHQRFLKKQFPRARALNNGRQT